jgi:hypothetical protein
MKIVKMHKGSREAFDDFIEQRLNEVEVDNDMADKYFADMNLPVPVIPVTKISFLSKHKTTLWLLLLLFIISVSMYVFVNNSSIKTSKESIAKNKHLLENEKSGINIINAEKKMDKAEFAIDNNDEEQNSKIINNINKPKDVITKKLDLVKRNPLSNNKSVLQKGAILKSENYIDTGMVVKKTTQILFDEKTSVISTPSNVLKSLKNDKKSTTTDSLYIVW